MAPPKKQQGFKPPAKAPKTKKTTTQQPSGQPSGQNRAPQTGPYEVINDPVAWANYTQWLNSQGSTQQGPSNFRASTQVSSTETEPEPDDVMEEDEEEEAADVGKTKAADWDEDDEVRLCQAWAYHTDNKDGIACRRPNFWKLCLTHYLANGGHSSRTHHSLCAKWRKMLTLMTVYNGFYHQATKLKASGLGDLDVANQTDADYQKLKKKPFPHKKAWDVVKDFDKWQEVALVGEGGSKRKVTQVEVEGSNYAGGQEEDGYAMPDLNAESTPTVSRRSKKSKSESTSAGVSDLEKNFASYTLKKEALIDKRIVQVDRKVEKDSLQIVDLKKKTETRDWRTFTEPHEHAKNKPRLLAVLIKKKTELAEAYEWDKYWEEDENKDQR